MPKKRSPGDGGLYYIKSRDLWRGVVELEERDGKRRQKMVHARTQRACKVKLDALKDEIRENGGEPLDKGTKLRDWAARWLDEYAKPNVDPKTFSTYRGLTNNWIVTTIGHKPVSSLRPSDVTAVRRAQVAADLSTSTIRQTHIVLSRMLEQARRERLCRGNVALDVDRPGKKKASVASVATKDREAFSTEDVVKLFAAAAKRKNGSMWWAKMLTGLRQSEILGAQLGDIDLDAGRYRVNWKLEELSSEHGCGDAVGGVWPCGKKRGGSCSARVFVVPDDFNMRQLVGRWHLTEPKSHTGKVVPLIPDLVDAIKQDLLLMSKKPNPHGLIWRQDDGSPITPKDEAEGWRQLLLDAGIITKAQAVPGGTDKTGHIARHTVVTALAELGIDMQLIAEIVGHADTSTTEGYRHARDAEKVEAMTRLGHFLRTGQKELPARSAQGSLTSVR